MRATSLVELICKRWGATLLLKIEPGCIWCLTLHIEVSFAILLRRQNLLYKLLLMMWCTLRAHRPWRHIPLALWIDWQPLRHWSSSKVGDWGLMRANVHLMSNKFFFLICLLGGGDMVESVRGYYIGLLIWNIHCQQLSGTCRIKNCSNPANFTNHCLETISLIRFVFQIQVF